MRFTIPFILLCCLGCSTANHKRRLDNDLQRLLSASVLTVFLLDPDLSQDEVGLAGETKGYFHGHRIIKEAVLQGELDRRRLLDPLQVAIDKKPPNSAACFFPRHGLRAVTEEKTTIDYLICFECKLIYIYEKGESFTTVSSSANNAFNSFLEEFGREVSKEQE